MRENTSVHRLLRRVLSLCLAVVLAVSLCVPALAAQKNYSASDYVQRLKDSVRGSATVDLDAGKDPMRWSGPWWSPTCPPPWSRPAP